MNRDYDHDFEDDFDEEERSANSAIREMAVQAAEHFAEHLPDPGDVVPRADVYAAGGFPPQPSGVVSVAEYQTWQFAAMRYIEAFRWIVLERTNRDPVTVHGQGLRFLAPGDVAPYAALAVRAKMQEMIRMFRRKVGALRVGALTPMEQQRLTDEMATIGRLRAASDRLFSNSNGEE